MRESLLRDFLRGSGDAAALAEGLEDVLGRGPLVSGSNLILDLEEEVSVGPEDLIRLCDATLDGGLDPDDLRAAARFLVAAAHFTWDETAPAGGLVAQVLREWSDPQSHYPMTTGNLRRYRQGLVAGTHPFTRGGSDR